MTQPLPGSYEWGFVYARIIHAIADTSDDADRYPEARPAKGSVKFTPMETLRKVAAEPTALVKHETVIARINDAGEISDAEGEPGIYLITGAYTVSFELASGNIASFSIEVTAEHTIENPLDLATVAPFQPPSGTPVTTLVVPAAPYEGATLGWSNGRLAWGGGSGSGLVPGAGAVVISWDDGWIEQLAIAAEAEARGQKHTFYIHTDAIGEEGRLTAEDIVRLHAAGHEIGSHGTDHSSFPSLSLAQVAAQLDDSKAILEGIIGAEVHSFAYPYGHRNYTTDAQAYGRYGTIQTLTGGQNLPPFTDMEGVKPFSVPRFDWGARVENYETAKRLVRLAARQPVLVHLYGHRPGHPADPPMSEFLEVLDLCQELGVPVITTTEAYGAQPIIDNPSFALGLAGWIEAKNAGGAIVANEFGPDGFLGKSAKLSAATAGDFAYVSQIVPVVPGRAYNLGGRARTELTGGTGGVYARIRWNTAQMQQVGASQGNPAYTGTGWEAFSVTGTAPPTARFAFADMLLLNAAGSADVSHMYFGEAGLGLFA